jgi:hypothetical protein
MICEFCVKAILASGKPWDYHQKTLSDLQTSNACVFCSRLLQDVEERCATTSPPLTNAANWPLHRWSVRRPGRIRESADAVIVTFRPTSHDGDRDTGQHDEQPAVETALPERAFYLFPEEGKIAIKPVRYWPRASADRREQILDMFLHSKSLG